MKGENDKAVHVSNLLLKYIIGAFLYDKYYIKFLDAEEEYVNSCNRYVNKKMEKEYRWYETVPAEYRRYIKTTNTVRLVADKTRMSGLLNGEKEDLKWFALFSHDIQSSRYVFPIEYGMPFRRLSAFEEGVLFRPWPVEADSGLKSCRYYYVCIETGLSEYDVCVDCWIKVNRMYEEIYSQARILYNLVNKCRDDANYKYTTEVLRADNSMLSPYIDSGIKLFMNNSKFEKSYVTSLYQV